MIIYMTTITYKDGRKAVRFSPNKRQYAGLSTDSHMRYMHVNDRGEVCGKPRSEKPFKFGEYRIERWALAYPRQVKGRKAASNG